MFYYTTKGETRGSCGHTHRQLFKAVECLLKDTLHCQATDQSPDRKIVDSDGRVYDIHDPNLDLLLLIEGPKGREHLRDLANQAGLGIDKSDEPKATYPEPEPHEVKLSYRKAFDIHMGACKFHAQRLLGTKAGAKLRPASLAAKTSLFATLDLLVELGLVEMDDWTKDHIEDDLAKSEKHDQANNILAILHLDSMIGRVVETLRKSGLQPEISRDVRVNYPQDTVTIFCQEVTLDGDWTRIVFDDHGDKVALRFHHSEVPSVTTRAR